MSLLVSIREHYIEWLNDEKFLLMNSYNKRTGDSKFFAVRCSKRGNSVYRQRIMKRFYQLSKNLSEVVFFNPFSKQDEYTCAIWLTLTYDTKRCSFADAWENIGIEFNRFRSWLQRTYGKISLLRCFESYKNGYPHIHAVIIFHDYIFNTFKSYSDKQKRFLWRIKDAPKIQEQWHSYVDVQAVYSMGGALDYLKKYLTKSIDIRNRNQTTINTLALTWFFHKRSFGLSPDLIHALHNSNIIRKILVQTDLFGKVVDEIEVSVVGVISGTVLNVHSNVNWFVLNDKQVKSALEELGERAWKNT